MTLGSILIDGMHGLGDSVYLKAFVRAAVHTHDRVFLQTPWPQLFADLDIRFLPKPTSLRTQQLNQQAWGAVHGWGPTDGALHAPGMRRVHLTYTPELLRRQSITQVLQSKASWSWGRALSWALPEQERNGLTPRSYAVVRPVTFRKEFPASGRNPDPVYIQQAIDQLIARGYDVVTLAHLAEGEEWFEGDPPTNQTLKFHNGAGGLEHVMQLVQHADVCVGGVGWIVPMAMAYMRPLFWIGGGVGAHNSPGVILDSRMNVSRVGYALPDAYCECEDRMHACSKHITNFQARFAQWLDGIESTGKRNG